jgi:hypothetical protein
VVKDNVKDNVVLNLTLTLTLTLTSTLILTGVLLMCHPDDQFSLQVIAYLQSIHPTISASFWFAGEG